MNTIRDAALWLAAVVGGLAALGVLWRWLSNGVKLSALLSSLPAWMASVDGKIDGLHARMNAAEASHEETLDEVRALRAEEATYRAEHSIYSEQMAGRVTALEDWRDRLHGDIDQN